MNRIATLIFLVHAVTLTLGAQNELSHEALFVSNKTFP
jgi:hypothetical protein